MIESITDACHALSMRMAKEYDNRLRDAVTRALGYSDWTPETLRGRLSRVLVGSSEVTTLDGKPIFEVLPIETKFDCTGHSYHAFAARKYRALV